MEADVNLRIAEYIDQDADNWIDYDDLCLLLASAASAPSLLPRRASSSARRPKTSASACIAWAGASPWTRHGSTALPLPMVGVTTSWNLRLFLKPTHLTLLVSPVISRSRRQSGRIFLMQPARTPLRGNSRGNHRSTQASTTMASPVARGSTL